MTSAMGMTMDTVMLARGGMTELVRGCDEDLKRRVTPLVREHNVALDLGGVERIDAAGIAALISLYGSARETGHQFTLANVPARVAEILALVGLDGILMTQSGAAARRKPCLERPAA